MKFMRLKTIYVMLMVMMMVLVLIMNMILRMMMVVIVVMINLTWDLISSTCKWKCFLKILMIVKEQPAFFFSFFGSTKNY